MRSHGDFYTRRRLAVTVFDRLYELPALLTFTLLQVHSKAKGIEYSKFLKTVPGIKAAVPGEILKRFFF